MATTKDITKTGRGKSEPEDQRISGPLSDEQVEELAARIVASGDDPERKTEAFLLLMDEIVRCDDSRASWTADIALQAAFGKSRQASDAARALVASLRTGESQPGPETTDNASRPDRQPPAEIEREGLPLLEKEQIVRLIDIIKDYGHPESGAAALVFLFDNILAHCSDEDYIFNVACNARDRAFYETVTAEAGIRTFAREACAAINEQLTEWETREIRRLA